MPSHVFDYWENWQQARSSNTLTVAIKVTAVCTIPFWRGCRKSFVICALRSMRSATGMFRVFRGLHYGIKFFVFASLIASKRLSDKGVAVKTLILSLQNTGNLTDSCSPASVERILGLISGFGIMFLVLLGLLASQCSMTRDPTRCQSHLKDHVCPP